MLFSGIPPFALAPSNELNSEFCRREPGWVFFPEPG